MSSLTKENIPAFVLENEKILKIHDLRVLGIYTFVKMMMNDGESSVSIIVDKIKDQFLIDDKEVISSFKIIIDNLMLVSMYKNK